jgi:hypothetical protein
MLEAFSSSASNNYVGTEQERKIKLQSASEKIRLYADSVGDLRQDAVWDVCGNIRTGKQEGLTNLDKAPTVARFATWCRELASQKTAAENREKYKRIETSHAVSKPWVDWRIVHRNKMEDERRAFIEEATLDQFKSHASQRKYPPGSTWYWSTQIVAGPIGSAGGCLNVQPKNDR